MSHVIYGLFLIFFLGGVALSTFFDLFAGSVLILSAFVLLLVYKIVKTLRPMNQNSEGKDFHWKIISLFSASVLIPCIIMAGFSLIFLKLGLQAWFHERVRTAIEKSESIADSYLKEHEKTLENTIVEMSTTINALAQVYNQFFFFFQKEIDAFFAVYESTIGADSLIFKNTPNPQEKGFPRRSQRTIIAQSQWSFALALRLERLQDKDIQRADQEGVVLLIAKDQGQTLAVMPLVSMPQTYLMVSRPIDRDILRNVMNVSKASNAYKHLFTQQQNFIFRFVTLFILVSFLLLLMSIYGGITFSRRLIIPIEQLLDAAQSVRQGNPKVVTLPKNASIRELESLISTFNAMIREMVNQKEALLDINQRLVDRTTFIESVLSSVSSGVLSLSKEGLITLYNEKAKVLLKKNTDFKGQNFTDILPETTPLFHEALLNPGVYQDKQITLLQAGMPSIFYFHILSNHDTREVIVTFDDITTLLAAQKKSAWADVARRVAHEVKNPLTPISLSAQRLRRRYAEKLNDPQDKDIFNDCIETIIRQVDYLGCLISEFSSFARMPTASLKPQKILHMIQQVFRFQAEAYPEILFELDQDHIDGDLVVHVDKNQLELVINNVLKNSIEAIQEKSALSPEVPYKGRILFSVTKSAKEIFLSIYDNGIGLDQDNILSLCEPYVTTKEDGTGLGLAIVQRIIDDHGGTFKLMPNPSGQGACVQIILPILSPDLKT